MPIRNLRYQLKEDVGLDYLELGGMTLAEKKFVDDYIAASEAKRKQFFEDRKRNRENSENFAKIKEMNRMRQYDNKININNEQSSSSHPYTASDGYTSNDLNDKDLNM